MKKIYPVVLAAFALSMSIASQGLAGTASSSSAGVALQISLVGKTSVTSIEVNQYSVPLTPGVKTYDVVAACQSGSFVLTIASPNEDQARIPCRAARAFAHVGFQAEAMCNAAGGNACTRSEGGSFYYYTTQ